MDDLHRLFGFARVAFFAVLTLAGIVMGIASTVLRARAARNWPKAHGTIIRSELVPESNSDDPDSPEILTYPVVQYAYEVDGRKYQSRQLSIVVGAALGPAPAELVAMFPDGANVPVFYNPSNHADSALDCRIPALVVSRTIKMVAVILAIGGICIFLSLR